MASLEARAQWQSERRIYTHDLPPGTTIYTAPYTRDARCRMKTRGHCHVDIRGSDRHNDLVSALVKDVEAADASHLYPGRSVWVANSDLRRIHDERVVRPSHPVSGHESQPAVNFTPLASEPELVQGALDGLPTTPTTTDSYFKHGL